MMHYEIVNLENKTVVGITARTNNGAPDMKMVIGGQWEQFFGKGIYDAIPHKSSGKALGIYTDYEGNETGDYTIMVAVETESAEEIPQNTIKRIIPDGKYAKFVVTGNLHEAVQKFWLDLWSIDLPRAFVCDFEEYQNSDEENAEIHVYIGLKS